jgi:hypothetical protein
MATTERRRWDIDERFVGVSDAGIATADVERLLAQTREPGWITEDAAMHLGPACLTAAAALDLEVLRLEVVEGDVLEVAARSRSERDARALREAAFALVGSFAESSTHVRERRDDDGGLELEVVTGVLPGDSEFATHGHLARVRLEAMSRR